MLITIRVPENTGRLFYSVVEDGYERESVPVTMGMIAYVETERVGGIIEGITDCERGEDVCADTAT